MTGPTPGNTLAIVAAAACAAIALAGCAADPAANAPLSLTPTAQFKPTVIQAPDQIALAIHAEGLSANQMAALTDFVGRWRDSGGGLVLVKAPVNGGDPRFARRDADAMAAYLVRLGVPAAGVRLVGYDAGHAPGAPVLASFDRYQAIQPDCSQGWTNLTSTGSNRPYASFGCAVTANLAQMVANPRDLVVPAAVDPADDSRRQVVLGKYRQGTTTSTSADTQASGTVSAQQ